MQLDAFFGLGPWNYQIDLDYHTTGLVGLLYRGRQTNTVRGVWEDERAEPSEFFGEGIWRGRRRRTLIGYYSRPAADQGTQSAAGERARAGATGPAASQHGYTERTCPADAQGRSGVTSCETSVRTYDGRRVLEIVAHTGARSGSSPPAAPSSAGQRCAATSRGANWQASCSGEDDPEHRTPLHGSAWLAPVLAGAPPLPVRIAFQTRWFGWATMYLTAATERPERAEIPDVAPDRAGSFQRAPQH